MNPVSRGIRNAFRNNIRAGSIVLILGLSIGLSLTMLVAQKAVDNKIKGVKSSIGNTITIAPAGFNPGSEANNALTMDDLNKVKALPHVTSLAETLTDRLPTTGSSSPSFSRFGASASDNSSSTSLASPTTLNAGGGGRHFFTNGGESDSTPTDFSLPVSFLGTNKPTSVEGDTITITSGKTIDGTADTNDTLISSQMATKNNLQVGSTFTAYNTTLTVAGIFSASTQAAQGTVAVSLSALERLSGQSGVVTSATATVDSLDNLASVTSAVKQQLGSSNADVQSAQDQADATVQPLNSVRTVATFSLIGAVVAGAIIILLTMVMIVRERKKEIGVVKAIGGSNLRIMGEFMVESLTLAVLGAVIGLIIGVVGGQPVTKMLVDNSTSNNTTNVANVQGPGGSPMAFNRSGNRGQTRSFGGKFSDGFRRNGAVKGISDIKTQVGPSILLDGFGAAILIAVLGSGLAAGLIARVRPSTVMRAE